MEREGEHAALKACLALSIVRMLRIDGTVGPLGKDVDGHSAKQIPCRDWHCDS